MQVLDGEEMRIQVVPGKLRMLVALDPNCTQQGSLQSAGPKAKDHQASALGSAHDLLEGLVAGAGLGYWDATRVTSIATKRMGST